MASVQFKDLTEGAEFTYNSLKYKKVPLIRVSCCTSLNAVSVDNPNQKIMVRPLEQVEVDEQQ